MDYCATSKLPTKTHTGGKPPIYYNVSLGVLKLVNFFGIACEPLYCKRALVISFKVQFGRYSIRDIKIKERKSKEEKEQRALGLGASKPCGKKLLACNMKLALLKKYVTTSQAGIVFKTLEGWQQQLFSC